MTELNRSTLSEQVAQELLSSIFSEGLRSYDKLPSESALATKFGVSRPVIREALRALAAIGVVATASGKQAVVHPVDPRLLSTFFRLAVHLEGATLRDVLELRRGVEMETAQLAAVRRSNADLAKLTEIVTNMRESLINSDVETHTELDLSFHMELARASGNALLEYLLASLRDVTFDTIREGMPLASDEENLADQQTHQQILEAVRRGSVAQSKRAMAKHFDDALARASRPGGQTADAEPQQESRSG